MNRDFLPNGRTRLLGILGEPLDHSLSPAIHTAVLRRLDRNLLYVPLPVPKARLSRFLVEAPSLGIVGVNVTTPFKEEVARRVASADAETARTAMVNTVSFARSRAGRTTGQGTDGAGILSWLESLRLDFEPLLVLGSGPTARSLLHRAWSRGWPSAVVTRSPARLERLLLRWPSVEARAWPLVAKARPVVLDWDMLRAGEVRSSLVVSTLPAKGWGTRAAWLKRLPRQARVLDMNYGEGRTRMAEIARREGLRAATGIGPLLHQASRSLSIWLGEEIAPSEFERAWGGRRSELRFHR